MAAGAATPAVRHHLRRRRARGREDAQRWRERLGHAGVARPPGPVVWIHGASVGESLSALPLIARIRRDWPDLNVLVTTGTVTSARLLAARLPEGVIHQYAPVDLPAAVTRFLAHWRPDLGMVLESEFWPNLLDAAQRQGIELILVNGRVSARSYATWRRLRPVIARLLDRFALILAQSEEDAGRLAALGARAPRCLGNLKFAAAPLAADPAVVQKLRRALKERPCWVAASTHPGEEEEIATAHAILARHHPGVLTIVVPRHPHRGPEIARALRHRGLRVARRSGGDETPPPGTDVYLADTLGELGLWYRLAEIAFVGGSLVPKGGQNMLEPARLGCAVLCGPHTANFQRVAEAMLATGGLRRVADAPELAASVSTLLRDSDTRTAMIAAAEHFAEAQSSVLDAVTAALAPHLDRAAAKRGDGPPSPAAAITRF
ncbi:MAG: 3-deoxy-D-manno-octulosonic acid transferase [Alphaproteobacteria bacterium]|nr:MAG: 3-deoxy-D-manno-octulosonic acid transferase [Alphaproteobacteria bacterium]